MAMRLLKEMATHSSILAWRIPWTEESGRPQSMGSQSQTMTERLSVHEISNISPKVLNSRNGSHAEILAEHLHVNIS